MKCKICKREQEFLNHWFSVDINIDTKICDECDLSMFEQCCDIQQELNECV